MVNRFVTQNIRRPIPFGLDKRTCHTPPLSPQGAPREQTGQHVRDRRGIVGREQAARHPVLDQFAVGGYGVAACEAMASGRLVMGHVDERTRAEVRDRTGLELPVHEATPESLEAELRRFIADPAAFAPTRTAGPAFVAAVHDGRRSAAALAPFLGLGT